MKKRRIAGNPMYSSRAAFRNCRYLLRYIEEKQAGEEYMELQKQAEKEVPDLQNRSLRRKKKSRLWKFPLILKLCRNRIQMYMHGFRFRKLLWIILFFSTARIMVII